MTCKSRSQQKHAETHITTPQFCEYFQGKCHILYRDNLHCRNRSGYFMQHLLPAITNTIYIHHSNFPHIHVSSLYTRKNTKKNISIIFHFRTCEGTLLWSMCLVLSISTLFAIGWPELTSFEGNMDEYQWHPSTRSITWGSSVGHAEIWCTFFLKLGSNS